MDAVPLLVEDATTGIREIDNAALRNRGAGSARSWSRRPNQGVGAPSSGRSHQTRVIPAPSRTTPHANDSWSTTRRPNPCSISGSGAEMWGSCCEPRSVTDSRTRSSSLVSSTRTASWSPTPACTTLFATSSLTIRTASDALFPGVPLSLERTNRRARLGASLPPLIQVQVGDREAGGLIAGVVMRPHPFASSQPIGAARERVSPRRAPPASRPAPAATPRVRACPHFARGVPSPG
jgi:hypothetical protein